MVIQQGMLSAQDLTNYIGFVATLHFVKKGFLCNLELQNK
jgi:hypothetical protein